MAETSSMWKVELEAIVPPQVLSLISKLESAGHEAYAVGGCVRDAMLGREPHDWDMTTSATPEEMKQAVSFKSLDTGLKHGTITFMVDDMPIETTVFRTEGAYSDGRHPDSIAFASTLEEDLSRRDFTVNAMAWSPSTGVIDPFGGASDLEKGLLRCVGDPRERFSEDGLRVMRALRFASVYGLEIEPVTAKAVHEKKSMLDAVSRERISSELSKMMSAPDGKHLASILDEFSDVVVQAVPELEPCLGYDQRNPHHDRDLWHHSLDVMASMPPNHELRLAGLFHDVGKPSCCTVDGNGVAHFYGHMEAGRRITESAMIRLKFSRKEIDSVSFLVAQHDNRPAATMKSARRFLARCGDEERARKLLMLMNADAEAHALGSDARLKERTSKFLPFMEQALVENTAFKVSDLEIGGRDLIDMGWEPGPEMGNELNRLFVSVMEGDIPNERDALLAAVGGTNSQATDRASVAGKDEGICSGADSHSRSSNSLLAYATDFADKIWVEPYVRNGIKVRGYWRKH